jgi:hypothetical protein
VQRAVKSRRFPWAEISHFVTHEAQLRIVKLKYDVLDELSFSRRRKEARKVRMQYAECNHGFLVKRLGNADLWAS